MSLVKTGIAKRKRYTSEKKDFYEKMVEKENIKVTILPSKSDTFEALYACDLLVAAFSTVITEALVLGKLAVTLNLTAKEHALYYREVTLRVNKKEDLIPAIAKALHDESTRERLRKAGKKLRSIVHISKTEKQQKEWLVLSNE